MEQNEQIPVLIGEDAVQMETAQTEEIAVSPEKNETGKMDSETLYRAVLGDETVKSRVLSDYLRSLKGVSLMTSAGVGVTAPPQKPKTIREAGERALNYLKNNVRA